MKGERKQVTVLFADLKGSMELLADRDPEEARELLDPVLERMMDAVHRYEGTVNQVMGDGIMALFGAPLAHEDHAVRACYAALDMQAAMRRYAEDCARDVGVEPQIRVGLNSGEVVVRAIGSDLHMDYTAVGQTTHLAARMEQLAAPGTTLLTADTLRLAEGYVRGRRRSARCRSRGSRRRSRSTSSSAPTRSARACTRPSARGLTRFVGRDRGARAPSPTALARVGAGQGQVVAIVGEPGVGKSRLVWEVSHSSRADGWRVLHAHSVSYGKATPYLPVIDLLKGYFQIEDRDDARAIREKATGRLLALDRAMEPAVSPILALLDVRAGRRRVAAPGSAAATPAHPGRGQAPPAARKPVAAAPAGVRGSPLDRQRDAGLPRRPRGQRTHRARAAARDVPTRIPARVGEQDVLHPAPAGPIAPRPRRRAARRPARKRRGRCGRSPRCSSRAPRVIPSSSRKAFARSWRPACSPVNAARIA